ncbi:MAG: polysaccharide deacetylase family protein [Deltaproteobacteria bacterium]|nr:polysaccharide deacetylase family protein [Deltaproteobacteria bacterium]
MVHPKCQKVTFLSKAEWTGLVSFLIAIPLSLIDVRLSVVPLAGFVLLCLVAPFLPFLGYYLPIISRGKSSEQAVALTFDDGPDPLSTPDLLRLLSKHQVKATFFVIGKKAFEHPELVKEIVSQGHSIGNHTYTHDNLMLLKGSHYLLNEIKKTQNVLREMGVISFAFRPPVGITSPGLHQVLLQLNLYTVNFSCRAFDNGNRRIRDLSKKILKRVHADDIILLHDTRPKNDHLFSCWLKEMDQILTGLGEKSLKVLPLSTLIGRPVMDVDKIMLDKNLHLERC